MSKTRRKHDSCPNCDENLADAMNFCPNCGQENHEVRVTVGMLIADVFMEFWSVDNKGLRSLGSLLFKPGDLSKKFIQGKRRSYNRPLRIYLFISFIFFLLTSISPEDSVNQVVPDEDTTAQIDTILGAGGIDLTIGDQTIGGPGSSDFEQALNKQVDYINTPEGIEALRRQMEDTIPIFSFLLIPLLALYMYWMFWKKDRYYVDSFVYALHCQTFGFLLLTILTLIQFVIDIPFGNLIVVGISAIYFVIAAKRLYEVSYISAMLRLAAVATVHVVISVLLMLIYLLLLVFFAI